MTVSKGLFNFKDVQEVKDSSGAEITELKDQAGNIMYGFYTLSADITNESFIASWGVVDDWGYNLDVESGDAMYYGHQVYYSATPIANYTTWITDCSNIQPPVESWVISSTTNTPKLRLTNPNAYSVTAYYKSSSSATTTTSLGTIATNASLDVTPNAGTYYFIGTSRGNAFTHKIRVYSTLSTTGTAPSAYTDYTTTFTQSYAVADYAQDATLYVNGIRTASRVTQAYTSPYANLTKPTYTVTLTPANWCTISLDKQSWAYSVSTSAAFGSTLTYYLKPSYTLSGRNVWNLYDNPASYWVTTSCYMIPGEDRAVSGTTGVTTHQTDYISGSSSALTLTVPLEYSEWPIVGRLQNDIFSSHTWSDEDSGDSGYGIDGYFQVYNTTTTSLTYWWGMAIKSGSYYIWTKGTVTVPASSVKKVSINFDFDSGYSKASAYNICVIICEEGTSNRVGTYGANAYNTL